MRKQQTQRSKVTIFQVAERAGVSIKTVSRVVNNEPNVRAATRDRVLEAIGELQYKPNEAARELSGKPSRSVGLVYENGNEFNYLQDVLDGALSACDGQGYTLLLCPLTLPLPSAKVAQRIRQFAAQARVQGIVLPPPMGDFPDVRTLLGELDMPIAAIAPREPIPQAINILCKDEEASYALTEHLIKLGHRAIGFIKGHPDHGASAKRFGGYRRALRKHHLVYRSALVQQGYFDFESGKSAVGKLLDLEEAPSAIVASNDDMAAGVLFGALQRGLTLPDDLSVVGFDDTRIASRMWPPLTTARQPTADMAKTAVSLLIAKLNGAAARPAADPFDCEIVIRESAA